MAKPGEKSWLTSDVLTKTLGQFTGDMSDAQLAAQGFNAEQIKAIQTQAKSAQDAATQVKTLPQVFDVARETIGSGWARPSRPYLVTSVRRKSPSPRCRTSSTGSSIATLRHVTPS
jgi:hypothetical protein